MKKQLIDAAMILFRGINIWVWSVFIKLFVVSFKTFRTLSWPTFVTVLGVIWKVYPQWILMQTG